MKEEFKNGLKKVGSLTLSFISFFSNIKVISAIIIAFSFLIALSLRILPARWGVYLTEFDPYYEYYLAKKIYENGISWWFSWWFTPNHTKDLLFWYPYGRDLIATSPPGISIISAYTYAFLKSLGINTSLYAVHAYTPAIWASLAIIIAYLIGVVLENNIVGLFAAFFLSINAAFLSRTTLGGKHEGVAIPLMLLSFLTFLEALKAKHISKNAVLSVISGVSLGYVAISWGGYLYPWTLLAVFILILVFINKADANSLLAYLVTNLVASSLIAITPRYGIKVVLYSLEGLIPLSSTIISIIALINIKRKIPYRKFLTSPIFYLLLALILSGLGIVTWKARIISGISGRIMSIIIPSHRGALIESVAEHKAPTWTMLYSDYNILIPLSLIGSYILLKRRNKASLFILLFYITSAYAAASFTRLTLLLAPAISLVAGFGLYVLLDGLFSLAEGKVTVPKRLRKDISILKESGAIVSIIIILAASVFVISSTPIDYAHTPSLILTSSVPISTNYFERYGDYKYDMVDWLSALEWMRNNLPPNAVIVSWWDYGYWISINTNRSSVCDNGTINGTQIALVARAFLSNETIALKIYKELGASYVVVFDPFFCFSGYLYGTPTGPTARICFPEPHGLGDFGKSYWMARIAGLNASKYIATATLSIQRYKFNLIVPANTTEAKEATLYHLLFIKTPQRYIYGFEPTPFFRGGKLNGYNGPLISIPLPTHFKLVYISKPNGWVLVYKILYNTTSING